MTTISTAPDVIRPYPGPRPFSLDEAPRFFGRSGETQDLMDLVLAYQIVVMHAQSGAGKSSLVNAGLCARLLERGISAVLTRIGGAPAEGVVEPKPDNVFESCALHNVKPLLPGTELPGEGWDRLFGAPNQLHVVIFDQFEELSTNFPDRWQDRRPFMEQLATRLRQHPDTRLLLVIKEDHLAELSPYADDFPTQLRIRFRLERLRRDAALEAVTGPLADTGYRFDPGVAEQLVDDLLSLRVLLDDGSRAVVHDEFVEPVHLQVSCESLWTRVVSLPSRTITSEQLVASGGVDEALAAFYDDCVAAAADASGLPEGTLRNWVQTQLITQTGRRSTVYEAFGEAAGLPANAIEALDAKHLIRGEWRGKSRWYELTHDRFIEPILRSNRGWFAAREGPGQIALRLYAASRRWRADGTQRISGVELREAAEWLETDTAKELPYHAELKEYVRASRAFEDHRRSVERLKVRALVASVAALVIAIGAGIYVWRLFRTTEQAKRQADHARLVLEAEEQLGVSPSTAFERLKEADRAWGGDRRIEGGLRRILLGISPYAIALLSGHNAAIRAMDVSPDGNVVLTAGVDGRVARWTWQTSTSLYPAKPLHDGEISQLLLSPDGVMLVTTGNNEQAGVWNASSLEPVHSFALSAPGTAAVFSRSGSHVYIGCRDGSVLAYSLPDLQRLTIAKHAGPVRLLTFSADGRRLASAGADGMVIVTDLESLSHHEFRFDDRAQTVGMSPRARIYGLDFNRDSTRIVAAGSNWSARIWSLTSGAERVITHKSSILATRFVTTPDGEVVASASYDGSIKLTTVDGGRVVELRHGAPINTIAVSPAQPLLAAGGEDGAILVIDVVTGAHAATLAGHVRGVMAAKFSADGQRLFSAGRDGTVRVWDIAAILQIPKWKVSDSALYGVGVREGLIWTSSHAGEVSTYRLAQSVGTLEDGERVNDLKAPARSVVLLRGVSPAPLPTSSMLRDGSDARGVPSPASSAGEGLGAFLAIAAGRRVLLWRTDARAPRLLGIVAEETDAILGIAAAGPTTLVVAGNDGKARMLEVADAIEKLAAFRSTRWRFPNREVDLRSLVRRGPVLDHGVAPLNDVDANGGWIVTAGADFKAKLWSADGRPIRTLAAHEGAILAARFSRDGRRLVTASVDGTAKIWETQTGRLLLDLQEFTGIVCSAAFSSNGRMVVTGGGDFSVKVWDVVSGSLLRDFRGHSGNACGVAFTPDDRQVIASGRDGLVTLHLCDVCGESRHMSVAVEQRLARFRETRLGQ